jgi:hypothetical protein
MPIILLGLGVILLSSVLKFGSGESETQSQDSSVERDGCGEWTDQYFDSCE